MWSSVFTYNIIVYTGPATLFIQNIPAGIKDGAILKFFNKGEVEITEMRRVEDKR